MKNQLVNLLHKLVDVKEPTSLHHGVLTICKVRNHENESIRFLWIGGES